jgi:succinyl-CoA synthetase beta subunit
VPDGDVAHSLEEARAIAHRLGYPVAMKACGPDVTHKSDLGLVRLNVTDVREHFDALRSASVSTGGGVLIERMLPYGVELILGARVTEFGPVVLVGAGGVLAELVDDTQLALAPIDVETARELIGRTRAARLLAGYRGDAAGDVDAAARRLARLSELICDLEDIVAEIEINPLIVTATGTHVADALVRRRDIKRT